MELMIPIVLGGPGSGNFGHAGRPGMRGGSAPGEGSASYKGGKSSDARRASAELLDHLNDDDHRDLDDLDFFTNAAKHHMAVHGWNDLKSSLNTISVIHDSMADSHHSKEDDFRKNGDYENANKHGVAAGLHEDAALEADNLINLINKVDKLIEKPTQLRDKSPSPPSIPYDTARELTTAEKPKGVSDERWKAMRQQIHLKGGKRDKSFHEQHLLENADAGGYLPPFPSHVLSLEEASLLLGDLEGHPFRGNQWTNGANVHMAPEGAGGGGAAPAGPHPAFAGFRGKARDIIRWCGREGMNAQQAKAALDRAGIKAPLPTIREQLPIGARGMTRSGRNAPTYVFTPDQKAVLRGERRATVMGLTEAQQRHAAEWQAQAGDRAARAQERAGRARVAPQARPAAPAPAAPAPAAPPAAVRPSQDGYDTKKAQIALAEASVQAARANIQNGIRNPQALRDRALAGAVAAQLHRDAAMAANREGRQGEMLAHMSKAQRHEDRVAHYNTRLPAGQQVDAARGDKAYVEGRIAAIRHQVAAAPQAAPPAPRAATPPEAMPHRPATAELDAKEVKLRETPISNLEMVGGGHVSGCYRGKMADGSTGYFKPQREENGFLATGQNVRMLTDCARQFVEHGYPAGQSYRREAAAYEIAKVVGMTDMVPAAVIREHPEKGVGVMIDEVKGKVAKDVMARGQDPFDGKLDCQRAAVYDFLIENVDRHQGNWIVKPDGKLGLIDHGYCLATQDNSPHYARNDRLLNHLPRNAEIPASIKDSLRDKWPALKTAMEKCGIEAEAINRCKHRYDKIMRARTFTDMAGNPMLFFM